MERIGVFGGSFDPVHWGHLFMAQLAREAASLDRVLFVPAASPPHKTGIRLAPADDRVEMLHGALAGEPSSEVSRVEIRPAGTVFTVDTLSVLESENPGAELHFIVGMDSLLELPTWRSPEQILARWKVVAVDRPGFDPAAVNPDLARRCLLVRGNPLGISSTQVRTRVRAGLTVRHLVPPAVDALIRERRLYAAS